MVGKPQMLRMGDEDTEREANGRAHEVMDRALDVQEALRFLNPASGRVEEQPMPDTDFTGAILETEVVKDTTEPHLSLSHPRQWHGQLARGAHRTQSRCQTPSEPVHARCP